MVVDSDSSSDCAVIDPAVTVWTFSVIITILAPEEVLDPDESATSLLRGLPSVVKSLDVEK